MCVGRFRGVLATLGFCGLRFCGWFGVCGLRLVCDIGFGFGALVFKLCGVVVVGF